MQWEVEGLISHLLKDQESDYQKDSGGAWLLLSEMDSWETDNERLRVINH